MLFVYSLNVPAGTAEDNPATLNCKLEPGVLKRIDVIFPFGCNCLVKVKILHGEKIIVPKNADAWLVGNGETVSIEEFLEHYDDPFQVKVIAASTGTNYPHIVYFRFHVVDREIAFPELRIAKILQKIAESLVVRKIG